MNRLVLFIFFIPTILFGQEATIQKSVVDKFGTSNLSAIKTMPELAKCISQLTTDRKAQLEMLLLWTDKYMYVDSVRFFKGGRPLTTSESLEKHIALCDEFSNILTDFCTAIKIPCIRIEGYVKYMNFKPTDNLEEANHAWNAVLIDSTWLMCDLFWSTSALVATDSSPSHFVKKLNTKYFLSPPHNFAVTHLPCDPVFQFDNYPIKVTAFTSVVKGVDSTIERMPYCNYNDSIKILMILKEDDRLLRIAIHSYLYNRANPNMLITESYNYGVSVVNNKKATKFELRRAKKYFGLAITLIDLSTKESIKALKPSCEKGISFIDKRLSDS